MAFGGDREPDDGQQPEDVTATHRHACTLCGTTMSVHELKTWPLFFAAVRSGAKRFEVRRDDRGFAVGDLLELREWTDGGGYTGAVFWCRVTYLLRDGQFGGTPGFVVLGIAPE